MEDGWEKQESFMAMEAKSESSLEDNKSTILPSNQKENTPQPQLEELVVFSHDDSKNQSTHSHIPYAETPIHHTGDGNRNTSSMHISENANLPMANHFKSGSRRLFQPFRIIASHHALTANSTSQLTDTSNGELLNPELPAPGINSRQSENIEVIEPKATSSLLVTIMPFAQLALVDRNNFSWVGGDFEKRFTRKVEVGLTAQLGKYFTAGVGYGFQTWQESAKPNSISQYTAHDPFVQVGGQIPLFKKLHVTTHVGSTLRFHKYTFMHQEFKNAEPFLTEKTGQGFLPDVFAGIGLSYEISSKDVLYSSIETGGRAFTIGFKRALFN